MTEADYDDADAEDAGQGIEAEMMIKAFVRASLVAGAATMGAVTCPGTPHAGDPEPPEPSWPVVAAAYAVLEKHCARCHQAGRLDAQEPAANFASILDMRALARHAPFVRAGKPDESSLYLAMLTKSMPPDVYHTGGIEPSAEEVRSVRTWIESLPARPEPIATDRAAGTGSGKPSLRLWSDKSVYKAGDGVTVFASPTIECRLTIINIDAEGQAIVLFPNDIERDNLVKSRQVVAIPGFNAAYRLKLQRQGNETIAGICLPGGGEPAGIKSRFANQRFTVLGDWRKHVDAAYTKEMEVRRMPEKTKRYRRRARGKERSLPAAPDPSKLIPALQLRSGLTLRVE